MRRVLKYTLPIDSQVHRFPMGQVVMAESGNGRLILWILVQVDPATLAADGSMDLVVIPTGSNVPESGLPVASVRDRSFVWHVFEVLS